MKKNNKHAQAIINKLREVLPPLKKMKANEVHVINLRANFGRYQIIISAEENDKRSLEINGQIHHLFLSPEKITANPSSNQVRDHMKDTVIMRDIDIHIVDKQGSGDIKAGKGWKEAVEAKELINLAGEQGQIILDEAKQAGHLPKAAYEIIEKDIIHALEERPEESIEEVSEMTVD